MQNIPPPGNMDGRLPCDCSAGHSAQWQNLELIFGGLLYISETGAREGIELRMRVWDHRKCSCTRVWDPRKLHISLYEKAQTIVSWMLPALKGFSDTHTRMDRYSFFLNQASLKNHFVFPDWCYKGLMSEYYSKTRHDPGFLDIDNWNLCCLLRKKFCLCQSLTHHRHEFGYELLKLTQWHKRSFFF